MAEIKFTPGPWLYDPQAETIATAERIIVYELGTNPADAHLIVASPELYGALAMMLDRFAGKFECDADQIAVETAIAALAKAETIP